VLDIIVLFVFKHVILLSLLFWLLSFLGSKLFKKKNYTATDEFFECGFFTTNKFNIIINFNIYVVFLLLILYDVEFLFLVPYLFNITLSTYTSLMVFIVFFMFIVLSFIYDWEVSALN